MHSMQKGRMLGASKLTDGKLFHIGSVAVGATTSASEKQVRLNFDQPETSGAPLTTVLLIIPRFELNQTY